MHRGAGTFVLGDRRIPISTGDIVFIPKGEWHGFENSAADTLLVWAISSSQYLELHRMLFSGNPPPPPNEGAAILRRYGFREGPPGKKTVETSWRSAVPCVVLPVAELRESVQRF